MAAAPLVQQMEQGLASRVANGVSGFLAPPSSGSTGQNLPSQAAKSAQSPAVSPLSSGVNAALLSLQNDTGAGQVSGHHHHHHGAGKYKAASAAADPSQFGGAGASGAGVSSAVTA
jgi:hypothetical protein